MDPFENCYFFFVLVSGAFCHLLDVYSYLSSVVFYLALLTSDSEFK